MKKFTTLIAALALPTMMWAQGWPANYGGVMLQGFYWDSYGETSWLSLEADVDNLAEAFDLVWIPQSANCGGQSMGYNPKHWFDNYDSSFGYEYELRSMINTFKSHGIGTIADIVINHRQNRGDEDNWTNFVEETYNGKTYTMTSKDICRDDDGGETAKHLQPGETLGGYDTGEDWPGMRDLDHTSANVQNTVKDYLAMLINDYGYVGFRYDMVRGYKASYTKMYNDHAKPQFSVGENWSGTSTISSWIDGTSKSSAAFDFQFRYTCRNAFNAGGNTPSSTGDMSKLNAQNDGNWPLISRNYNGGNYRQYAVTFVENHDTQYRDASNPLDPLKKDTIAANAYMLAMPGTPCVFYPHWKAYKQEIKALSAARKLAGITNTSSYQLKAAAAARAAFTVTGTKSNLTVCVGRTASSYTLNGTTEILSGYHYKYLLDNSAEVAWVDLPNGQYKISDNKQAKLIAVSATSGAQIVYTTDGSNPTASNGTKVASGSKITINKEMTLKAGLLVGGQVKNICTRVYKIKPEFVPYKATIYLKDPMLSDAKWPNVNYYIWSGADNNKELMGSWPGSPVTDTKVVDGVKYYYKTFDFTMEDYYIQAVFNNGVDPTSTDPKNIQSDDTPRIYADAVFALGDLNTGNGHYRLSNITSDELVKKLNEAGGDPGNKYDVNKDGKVDVGDVNTVLGDILATGGKTIAYDVNGDGKVDVGDVNSILAAILGN